MAEESQVTEVFTLPEGRLINHSLFTKDAYKGDKGREGTPAYKIEIAIPDGSELEKLTDRLCDAADDKWGAGAGDDEDLILPLLDGNKLKRKRERKGKEGDAYEDMTVIRAKTIYNADGVDGPGGIQVYDEDAVRVPPARQGEVYQGCYGIAAVTISFYVDESTGNNAITLYLSAFQKTRDGERLVTATDRSGLFQPTRERGEGEGGRRRRRRRLPRNED